MYGLYHHQSFIYSYECAENHLDNNSSDICADSLTHVVHKTDAMSGKLPLCFGLLLTHACKRLD